MSNGKTESVSWHGKCPRELLKFSITTLYAPLWELFGELCDLPKLCGNRVEMFDGKCLTFSVIYLGRVVKY